MRTKQKKNKKPSITITELLATNATAPARKILSQYGKGDPKNYGELQQKLVDLYRECPDKKQLEKQLAEIHPHKDWILEHCAPKPTIPINPEKTEPAKDALDQSGTLKVVHDGYSSANGLEAHYKHLHSNACGCQHSGFNGPQQNNSQSTHNNNTLICAVAIVALVGIFIYNKRA